MKNGLLVFLAAFVALGLSWCGFVLAPVMQLGARNRPPFSIRPTFIRLAAPARRIRACRFIAPTAAPPATPNRSGRPALRATSC